MKKENIIKLVGTIAVCELAGVVGSVFTTPAISGWYAGLIKPTLNPPNWVFGPVWTSLFALMGIALYLVWEKRGKNKKATEAINYFILQLILNVALSAVFFGLKNPAAAFFEIILLWLAILATIITFKRVSSLAAWLLLPYILWVTFAAYLNFVIWLLN